jgi:phage gpG-like protein
MNLEVSIDRIPFVNLNDKYASLVDKAFKEFSYDIVNEARNNILLGTSGLRSRSGNLVKSIVVNHKQNFNRGGQAFFTLAAGNSRVPYAAIHEYGGVVRPAKGKYLTFNVNQRWVRVTQVVIPPRPYLTPAVNKFRNTFDSYIQDQFDSLGDNI